MVKKSAARIVGGVLVALAVLIVVGVMLMRGEEAERSGVAPSVQDMQADTESKSYGMTSEEEVGKMAPDFELPTMKGQPFRLADHRGEVVLLNFWATWCAPCRVEIPDFIELQKELGDQGVQFVGVALDTEGFEAVRPFAEEMGINYPIVMDVGEISELYGGIFALPTTVIIDRQGRIHQKVAGMLTEDDLRPLLEKLIQGEAAG